MKHSIKVVALCLFLGIIGPFINRASCAEEPFDALIHCKEAYCPGHIGMAGHDTLAKLAIIKIWRQTNATSQLVELFPKCNAQGQAYVLGALYHFDKTQFERLAAEFVKDKNKIITASSCSIDHDDREELIKLMQNSNSTMAFDDFPQTLEELRKEYKKKFFEQCDALAEMHEFKRAVTNYDIILPMSGIDEQTVELTPRQKKSLAYTIDWQWLKQGDRWTANPSIDEISEAINEIDKTKFLQKLNRRLKLKLKIDAAFGNFYTPPPDSDKPSEEDDEVIQAKTLFKSIGYPVTNKNKLIQITAESDNNVPLILWHPQHTELWVITWNLQISPDWKKACEKQTGQKLNSYEVSANWIATCNNAGKLKMLRIR